MDVVTQIVSVRSRERDGLQSMLGASVIAHVGLIAIVFLAPASWFGVTVEREPENVMTISLGGAPGPRDGGLTMMGGRPIQQVLPVEAKRAIEPIRPPAAREPEMIEPKKTAPKRVETKIPDEAKDPRGRTPTRGEEVQKGSTVADTGGRGQGFGLSRGGGGTGGYLDIANFCCPEYLSILLDLILRNWDSKQQAAGTTIVKFTIHRDGKISDLLVEKSSGYPALDGLATRAVLLNRQLPPLPAAFTEPSLTIHLIFEYQR
jgi:TonB family protein